MQPSPAAQTVANSTSPNHPCVVWGSCILWLISMFSILWSLILFFCVGNILVITGTDIINAIVLLSGIIMLPTNVYILCAVARGKKICHNTRVVCCPMWLCIMWIIIVNCLGVGCCIHKIYTCRGATVEKMDKTMKHYRSVPKYKHFVDNVQWSLKCCGINSYQDWFDRNWYDKIRDYEWDPNSSRRGGRKRNDIEVTDSVPLSCCKSGSCISNYLLELGTHSINTKGCGNLLTRIIMASMIAHLVIFLSVIIVEIIILRLITQTKGCQSTKKLQNMNVRHIMSVNDHFASSSNSMELNPEDTDDENEVHLRDVQLSDGVVKSRNNRIPDDDEYSESP
ncbi:hypothetical protein PYW07_015384 [Mythimna separata]|uniref:Uncharacterized protein n=1 Tax=Mythimna separata TaxID=271217 RepID=A0AAD7Z048_MYTSE|nr:hypothetical protein PYW07_015384 [Mythimna separata]